MGDAVIGGTLQGVSRRMPDVGGLGLAVDALAHPVWWLGVRALIGASGERAVAVYGSSATGGGYGDLRRWSLLQSRMSK